MTYRTPLAVLQPLLVVLTALSLPATALAYCDEAVDPRSSARGLPDGNVLGLSELFDGPAMGNAKEQLASLAREAIAGSADVRGAEHGRSAAGYDLQQVEAGRSPVVGLSLNTGLGQTRTSTQPTSAGFVGAGGVSVSAPLYDGGRLDASTDYRRRLLEAGGANLGSSRERVVDEAVASAIERNRYRLQSKVYQQYATKLACLVQSLEKIVAQDRGRASELIQARKGQRQAEISREEAISGLRQADVRLRKLVGDNVMPWGAVGVPLLEVYNLEAVVAEIGGSPEVRQLKLQADAMESLAQASKAESQPRVNWSVGGNAGRTAQVSSAGWNAGVTVTYTLSDGGAIAAGANAALERARQARRQQEALVSERVKLANTYHLAANAALQRARNYSEVLKDSDLVRNYTFEQWSKLGRRSLFDLISAESEHYQLRIAYINALHDGMVASAQLRTMGAGLLPWIAPELAPPAAATTR
jgi:adhesin transport system outer membrane protein